MGCLLTADLCLQHYFAPIISEKNVDTGAYRYRPGPPLLPLPLLLQAYLLVSGFPVFLLAVSPTVHNHSTFTLGAALEFTQPWLPHPHPH